MPLKELENDSSLVTKSNRHVCVLVIQRAQSSHAHFYCNFSSFLVKVSLSKLQSVVDQRFSSIDLGDQVTRDLSKIIRSSNYGLVYEGTLGAEQKKVAVKVICYGDKGAHPELEVSTLFIVLLSMCMTAFQRVLRKVYVWSKLNHVNIIALLWITTVFDHLISIVSPLMSGGNAFDYVQNTNVDPRPLVCCLMVSHMLYASATCRSWELQTHCIISTCMSRVLLYMETSKAWVYSFLIWQMFNSTNLIIVQHFDLWWWTCAPYRFWFLSPCQCFI